MTAFNRGLLRVQAFLENAAMAVAGMVLLGMGLLIAGSILGKHLFLRPVPDSLLLVGLLNVAVIVLPFAYVERQRGHIAVTVTTDWMGVRVIGALRAFGALAMGLFFGGIGLMVVQRMPLEIQRATYYDGVLQVPTWPMKALFGFAILLFVARLFLSVLAGIRTALTGIDDAPPPRAGDEEV
jgi:TRAP-type C4-dicarboxylate transport system permease small subunit